MNFKDTEAIYLQIADYVCENITQSKWLSDGKIPSVRDMAVEMQVNPNTVTRTYDYLQSQEIIYSKRGMGQFVTPDAVARIKNIRQERFLKKELPDFFASLYLLDIDLDKVMQYYEDFKNSKTEEN